MPEPFLRHDDGVIGERSVRRPRRDQRLEAGAARVGKREGGGRVRIRRRSGAAPARRSSRRRRRAAGSPPAGRGAPASSSADRPDRRHGGGDAAPGENREAKRLRLRLLGASAVDALGFGDGAFRRYGVRRRRGCFGGAPRGFAARSIAGVGAASRLAQLRRRALRRRRRRSHALRARGSPASRRGRQLPRPERRVRRPPSAQRVSWPKSCRSIHGFRKRSGPPPSSCALADAPNDDASARERRRCRGRLTPPTIRRGDSASLRSSDCRRPLPDCGGAPRRRP